MQSESPLEPKKIVFFFHEKKALIVPKIVAKNAKIAPKMLYFMTKCPKIAYLDIFDHGNKNWNTHLVQKYCITSRYTCPFA